MLFALALVLFWTFGGCPGLTGSPPVTTGSTDSTDTGGSSDASDGTGGTSNGSVDVPDIEYCDDVTDWDAARVQFEEQVVTLVNARRAAGAACGTEGTFGPAAALTANSNLRCAARVQSLDMDT